MCSSCGGTTSCRGSLNWSRVTRSTSAPCSRAWPSYAAPAPATPRPAPGAFENSFGKGLQRLVAVVERYPDLKASNSFLDLQRELADTENQIQFARRYYNGAVNAFNTRIDTFPDLVVARLFRFARSDYFELEQSQAALPPPVALA